MGLKNRHAGQYYLSIVNPPPPKEAKAPEVRKAENIPPPNSENNFWVARLEALVEDWKKGKR